MVDAPDSGAIICHNDAGPYNTVFRNTGPVGFIDWDVAAPGPALYDVAHAAWRWVPLQDAFWAPIDDQPCRLRRFCEAYGLTATERGELLPLVRRRQEVDLATIQTWGQAGKPGWDRLWQIGHVDAIRACLTWIEENEHSLTETLRV
jgi:Ser/Thr protein kinase RdoA (MazF antagonist)